jgi:hypothetical protein
MRNDAGNGCPGHPFEDGDVRFHAVETVLEQLPQLDLVALECRLQFVEPLLERGHGCSRCPSLFVGNPLGVFQAS